MSRGQAAPEPGSSTDRPTVLVTGFEPFDGMASNPSWEAARAVQDYWASRESREAAEVVARRLPVDFVQAPRALAALVAEVRPELVLSLGVAVGRQELGIERVAINCVDARIPDEAGLQPRGAWIDHQAPAAYFSTLPLRAVVDAWERSRIPGRISNSAGTYVCNRVMFELLGHAEHWGLEQAGFLHVPPTPGLHPGSEQGLPQEVTDRGVVLAVETMLRLRHRD